MSTSISKTFSAVEQAGAALFVKHKNSFTYALTGTFTATIAIEKSEDGGQSWAAVQSFTTTASGTILAEAKNGASVDFRARCSAYTSGSPIMVLANADATLRQVVNNDGTVLETVTESGVTTEVRVGQKVFVPAHLGKAGATSGFVVGATSDISLVTCPASKTASTYVVSVPSLKIGATITGFSIVGRVNSAGGTVTVDADLRSQTAAAASTVDASVGTMTQLSVTAQTVMSAANTAKSGLAAVFVDGVNFYLLVTVTTAASTDIAIQGFIFTVSQV